MSNGSGTSLIFESLVFLAEERTKSKSFVLMIVLINNHAKFEAKRTSHLSSVWVLVNKD